MTLLAMTPYAADRNLGRAYNEAMEILPADGWAFFMDHDMMLTTREWYRQVAEAIAFKPEAGVFVATTNRIAAPWQQVGDREDHDIRHHRRFGRDRMGIRTLLDITDTKGWGGVAFALSKRAWRAAGGFADGLLCVDHSIHFRLRAAGYRSYLLEGLYVYHWRRACGDELPADTPRVESCPCRGRETPPTVRLALP